MDDRIDAAFRAAPRARFLPRGARFRAGVDGPIALGHGATCSQPRTVRDMLALLAPDAGDRVLDVGAGSGWTTALLAELVGPTGAVRGVELEPALASRGARTLAAGPWWWASIHPADPRVIGDPAHGPYDRILVSADAQALPPDLLGSLADESRLVLPVRGTMTLLVRSGGADTVSSHGSYRFVPLR